MGHKATPRRTGEMKKQIVRWPFKWIVKNTKKGKTKKEMVVHSPPTW